GNLRFGKFLLIWVSPLLIKSAIRLGIYSILLGLFFLSSKMAIPFLLHNSLSILFLLLPRYPITFKEGAFSIRSASKINPSSRRSIPASFNFSSSNFFTIFTVNPSFLRKFNDLVGTFSVTRQAILFLG